MKSEDKVHMVTKRSGDVVVIQLHGVRGIAAPDFWPDHELKVALIGENLRVIFDVEEYPVIRRDLAQWIVDAADYCRGLGVRHIGVVSRFAAARVDPFMGLWRGLSAWPSWPGVDVVEADDETPGTWTVVRLPRLLVRAIPLPAVSTDLIIDASAVSEIESPGVFWLVQLIQRHRLGGCQCEIVGQRGILSRILDRLDLPMAARDGPRLPKDLVAAVQ